MTNKYLMSYDNTGYIEQLLPKIGYSSPQNRYCFSFQNR